LEEGKSYILDSNITVRCNDTDTDNDFDTRIITIKGKPLREDSSIDIEKIFDLGSDKAAKFGQNIRIKLNAYKGNTNKKSIAVWAEDSKGNRLSKQSKTNLENKYTNYSLTLPVQLKPNCNEKFDEDDDYIIIAKGLDSEDEEEFEIDGLTDNLCEVLVVESKKISSKNFNFELTEFNNKVEIGKQFNSMVMFDNNNDKNMNIKVWSYVYRGPKSYSGDREENMKEFILNANSIMFVELSNVVEDAEPGNYKFKVFVNKNNQKTNNQLTRDIVVSKNLNKNENLEYNNIISNNGENLITNNVILSNKGIVYESTTEKAKKLVTTFIIILLALLNVVFIWRR